MSERHQRQVAARWIADGDRPLVGRFGAFMWSYDGTYLTLSVNGQALCTARLQ